MEITWDSTRTVPAPNKPIGPLSRHLFSAYVADGAKPRSQWAAGPELELFGYHRKSLERIDQTTVKRILEGFGEIGAELIFEDDRPIEASLDWGWLTVEPGGQIEFSGMRRDALADVEADVGRFLAHLGELARKYDTVFIAAGFDPLRGAGEQRWYPKRRYEVMRPYFSSGGRRGWDMMARTASIQANIDFESESDLGAKFTTGNRLGPIVAAIFANSPFEAGTLTGYKSRRYAAWLETDRDRSGVSPAAITDEFSIDAFVDYATRVPMLFARRDGRYVDLAGESFDRFLERGAGNVSPIFQDFTDHLTTIFTEARVKQHIEMRSADAGGLEWVLACMAFWKGVAYDKSALASALEIAPRTDSAGYRRLQSAVAREALNARYDGHRVLDVARDVVQLAGEGLDRVAPEERKYLAPLEERVLDHGLSPADVLVRNFEGSWHRDMAKVVANMRVA